MFEDLEFYELWDYQWENSPLLRSLEVLGGFILLLFLGWTILGGGQLGDIALFSAIMFLFAAVLWIGDAIDEDNPVAESVGWGQNTEQAILALCAGVVVSYFIVGYSGSYMTGAITGGVAALTWWKLLIAPFAEEMTWRGVLVPSLSKLLNGIINEEQMAGILGMILGNGVFVLYHFFVYGWSTGILAFLFLSAMIWSVGNNIFHSTTFSYGAHTALNFFVLHNSGMI